MITRGWWLESRYCYYHQSNDGLIEDETGRWTSGGWSGDRPPASAYGACLPATKSECAVGTGPYTNGTTAYCAEACVWNDTASALGADGYCATRSSLTGGTGYPMPSNESIIKLVGPSTPLKSHTKLSFYGDSITFLDRYESILRAAIASGPGTSTMTNITLINQGVNGGTVTDLVKGYSPWGHLDPHEKQTNVTFAETIARDKPDVVAIQIGVNDVWQQPQRGEDVSTYADVLQHQIVQVAKQSGAKVYLMSISIIGEKTDLPGPSLTNHTYLHKYLAAQQAVGLAEGIPVIDVLSRDIAYDLQNNCLDLRGGVLNGGSGVHPYPQQGAMMLANAHAEGIVEVLQG